MSSESGVPGFPRPDLMDKSELVEFVRLIGVAARYGHLEEQLSQIVKTGPIWAGDLIHKGHRNELKQLGAIVEVYREGSMGWYAANGFGGRLLGLMGWLHSPVKTEGTNEAV